MLLTNYTPVPSICTEWKVKLNNAEVQEQNRLSESENSFKMKN